MVEEKRDPPVHTIRVGGVKGSIWKNTIEKNGQKFDVYSTTINRSYKKGEDWNTTDSYRLNDLHAVCTISQLAFQKIAELKQGEASASHLFLSPYEDLFIACPQCSETHYRNQHHVCKEVIVE